MFATGFVVCYWAEAHPYNMIHGAQQARTATAPGGNMEGKEVRNGIAESTLFATITTDASCGAVNGMHDSFTPLGGMIPLVNIMLGEVVFGGVGSGGSAFTDYSRQRRDRLEYKTGIRFLLWWLHDRTDHPLLGLPVRGVPGR